LRQPDFENLKKVLSRQAPGRPTLFEFYMNPRLYHRLCKEPDAPAPTDHLELARLMVRGFHAGGYDYATVVAADYGFPRGDTHRLASVSLNEGSVIHDRESFKAYAWPDPAAADYSRLEVLKADMAPGMKLAVMGPDGVLENVTGLVGYENLCAMLYEDPDLAGDIFDAVGSRLLEYYRRALAFDSVGLAISNDDWGFKTQTLLSPPQLRKYVFPWHKRIVEAAHQAGKFAVLHSCGQLEAVMEDVITDMKFDGKHSYEDCILPVEQAYERWGGRIAILGGLDVDFMSRSTPERIRERATKMLQQSAKKGGYALGTGNSVPEYLPEENYLAMIEAAGR
jgi:uroporphyrinogen decarboxylase